MTTNNFKPRASYLRELNVPHQVNRNKELRLSMQQFKIQLNRKPVPTINISPETVPKAKSPPSSRKVTQQTHRPLSQVKNYREILNKLQQSTVSTPHQQPAGSTLWRLNNPRSSQEKIIACIRKKMETVRKAKEQKPAEVMKSASTLPRQSKLKLF